MEQIVIETKIVKEYETTLERLNQIKVELKQEAVALRILKHEFKNGQRGTNKGPRVWQYEVIRAKHNWRHKHIAYCLLRGRTYEQIERNCDEYNKPNILLVEKYRKEIING